MTIERQPWWRGAANRSHEWFGRALAAQLREPHGPAGRAMGIVLNRGNRRINAGAVDALELQPDSSALEVGFGGGAALARMLGSTGGFVAGIELSDAMIAAARRRFRTELESGRFEVRKGSAQRIPYDDDRFERVLAVQTIYFWPEPDAGLREIRRVLRPRGRIVIATAAKEEMEKRRFTRHGFRKFTESELCDRVAEAGFVAVAVERDGPRIFTTGLKPG